MAEKPYTRLALTEEEFKRVHGAVNASRAVVFERWRDATEAAAKHYYQERMDEYDRLLAKFDAVLIADTSQDAEPEEDEDEEDEEA